MLPPPSRASCPRAAATTVLLLLLLAWCSVMLPNAKAANTKAPHPHKGLLERYDLKVPKIPLDGAALAKLKKGQPVKKQINAAGGKSGGRGIVVQDVHAPSSVVMDRILDFKKYPQMVPNVAKCENYAQRRMVNGDHELKTRFVLSILGFKLEYYVRHVYRPSILTLTWTLDYDRTSDFDDTVGTWSVVPLDGKGGEWSRVFYSIDLRIPSWIPSFVVNILNTQALTSATAWVKTQSEKTYKEQLKNKGGKTPAAAATSAAAATAAGAVAVGGGGKGQAKKGGGNRFGGGDLWETFIEEYSDMIDTSKYAQKVEANRQKRAAKAAKKAKGKGATGGRGGEGASSPGHDDSRNLLVFAWVSILLYGLISLWNPPEEKKTSKRKAAAASK